MIKKLRLKNYKCFNNHTIELEQLTLFAGSNASGKSSAIQALLLYLYTLTTQAKDILASDALSIELGSPRDLISQNPIDNINEISIQIMEEKCEQEVVYLILPASFALNVVKENNLQYTHFYY